jgi:hypothetical protein
LITPGAVSPRAAHSLLLQDFLQVAFLELCCQRPC